MPPRITETQRRAIRHALADGKSRDTIATEVGVTARQVAAVAAHITMGSYGNPSGSRSNAAIKPDTRTRSRRNGGIKSDAVRAPRGKAESQADAPEALVQRQVALPLSKHAIRLGRNCDTQAAVMWDPLPSAALPNPHMLVVGGSGFGKTYACACLIAELVQRGLPSIVLDYAQGFVEEALPPGFLEHVSIHEIQASRSGIDLNPLESLPSDGLGPVNVAQRVADTFKRVFPQLGIQQHAVLRDAVLELLSRAGIRAETPSSWSRPPPKFKALHEHLVYLSEEAEGPSRRAIRSLTAHVSTIFVFNTFRPGGYRLDWKSLASADKITVVQLKGLEHSLSKAVTEFMLWSLIGFAEDRGPHKMSTFVMLDEAHRLSFDDGSPVERLLREGRRFGLGVMLASQQPSDFGSIAFANTASKLIFQIDDDKGYVSRQIARKTSTHSQREIEKIITRIPRGVAYAVLGNSGQLVSVEPFDARAKRWPRSGET